MASLMGRMEIANLCVDTCLGIKEGDKVLVVVDRERLEYGEALSAAANLRGAETAVTILPDPKHHEMEPSEMVVAAMNAADVLIYSLSDLGIVHFTHSKARQEARERGIRFAGFTPLPPGSHVTPEDLHATTERVSRLVERLTAADSARVTTALGTDLTMSLKGRKGLGVSPICTEYEPGRGAHMPNYSDAHIAPVEGTAEGTAIIDGMVHQIGFVREPLRITIEKGWITDISGGADAARLRAVWDQADENATNLAELGMGTVSNALPVGSNLDKRLLGTAHIGIGDSFVHGGKVQSNMHMDALMYGATVELDG
ncbi:aminopeptidase, partial [Nitrospinota bacterium]